jgi:hypothetical protein
MPGLYTEADYENSVVELFKNMGYTTCTVLILREISRVLSIMMYL